MEENKESQSFGSKAWELFDKFVYFVMVKILHLKFLDKRWEDFMQFVKFCLVGVSNTLLSYVINAAVIFSFNEIFHIFPNTYFIWGNTIAFIISVAWSFYWNSRYVFDLQTGKRSFPWKALVKTYISYGFTGIILSNILSVLWIRGLGISEYIAPLLNLVLSIPINFLMNKLWAFKGDK